MTAELQIERDISLAVKKIFNTSDGEYVVAHLADFCHATKSLAEKPAAGPMDVHWLLVLEGRRQVFLWLREKLSLDDAELVRVIREGAGRMARAANYTGVWS